MPLRMATRDGRGARGVTIIGTPVPIPPVDPFAVAGSWGQYARGDETARAAFTTAYLPERGSTIGMVFDDLAVQWSEIATLAKIGTPEWNALADWVKAAPGRRLCLTIGLCPSSQKGIPGLTAAATTEAGTWDSLGTQLAATGIADRIILRPGHEQNREFGYPWSRQTGEDRAAWAAAYVAAFREMVTRLRAKVPGLHVCWNVNQDYAWTDCYPGAAFVSDVGLNAYGTKFQTTPPTDFETADFTRRGTFRLGNFAAYARSIGKPLSIPEFCPVGRGPADGASQLRGPGDGQFYMAEVFDIVRDHVAAGGAFDWACYWAVPYAGHNDPLQTSDLPLSMAVFKARLGQRRSQLPGPLVQWAHNSEVGALPLEWSLNTDPMRYLTLTTAPAGVRQGSRGLAAAATGGLADATVTKTGLVTQGQRWSYQAWFKITAGFALSETFRDFRLLAVSNESGDLVRVILTANTVPSFRLDRGLPAYSRFGNNVGSAARDVWHLVRIECTGVGTTNGTLTVLLNGSVLATEAGVNLSTVAGATRVRVGPHSAAGTSMTGTIYYDDGAFDGRAVVN